MLYLILQGGLFDWYPPKFVKYKIPCYLPDIKEFRGVPVKRTPCMKPITRWDWGANTIFLKYRVDHESRPSGIVPCNPSSTLPRFATQGSFRG